MDDTQASAVLLEHGEPPRPVRRVGGLVCAGVDLVLDDRADFLVDARRDWDVLEDPGRVRDDGELYRREEVAAKASSLGIGPRERPLVLAHEVVDEIQFGWPKEGRMVCAKSIPSLLRVAAGRLVWWRVRVQGWHDGERVPDDVSLYPKVCWQSGEDGLDLLRDWLVLLRLFGFRRLREGVKVRRALVYSRNVQRETRLEFRNERDLACDRSPR